MATVSFITLGCAKNEVDTDRMRARLLAGGHSLVEDAAEADVVVVNTCAFITEATEEAISVILEAAALPRMVAGTARLLVCGCLPSRYGAKLAEGLPEVTAFLGVDEEERILALVEGEGGATQDARRPAVRPDAHSAPAEPGGTGAKAPGRAHGVLTRTVSAPWAYVKIAEGCDRRCSFCTIPLIRGRYQSRPAGEILAEAAELVAGGVRELILIAQDTSIWGRDLGREPACAEGEARVEAPEPARAAPPEPARSAPPEPANLAGLLHLLAIRFPETWIRLLYLQPSGITDELLAVMAAHHNICDYLDIPLQHASERVLRDMNRAGNATVYLQLLARIRAALPDAVLRTTVIAGFPGETRAEARELERFIEEADFDYVGVFLYSQEEGTVAGARPDQVPMRTRRRRAQRLRDRADATGFARARALLGSTVEVLITQVDEDVSEEPYPLLGRTRGQAPEVDGMVHLDEGRVGQRRFARIVEACCYELDGRVCDA
ncbi:MAG: 30S ribosomal protein S12 methylthiotransferase RimO [Coriobacteriales bacterium]|jgi:ribosomal protein S12 methylthiotransferase|nr:30S ribosomal protein S12 methylthiotransferase RimO [Coriobacteriales bacterium]